LLTARRAGRFIFYAVNWSETASLIRFLTEDCCAEMHTKLAAAATAPQTSERDACCSDEQQPAVRRNARKRVAV
jgi:hypothetical protein